MFKKQIQFFKIELHINQSPQIAKTQAITGEDPAIGYSYFQVFQLLNIKD